MRILHIIENLDDAYGGPAKSVPFLAYALEKLGVENILFSVKINNRESNEIIEKYGLTWINVPLTFSKKFKYSKQFLDVLKSYVTKETIIHIHGLWTYPVYCGYKIAKKTEIPYIISVRGMLYNWALNRSKLKKKIIWVLYQKKILENACFIHATEPQEKEAIQQLGFRNPIKVIPNCLEIKNIDNILTKLEAKKFLKFDLHKKFLLFLGRIHPKKGLFELVKSFNSLSKNFHNWNLVVAGPIDDKNYFKKIINLINISNLKERIIFTGVVTGEKKEYIYKAADVFVLPSYSENFGMTIAEALAHGLPIITTQNTPWQILIEKKAGWWIPLTEDALVKALSEAMSLSDKEREEMGKRGKEIVKQFDCDNIAKKFKKLYEKCLGGSLWSF